MTLANKYLRYSPKITLEIFKLIWDKLIESGFKSRYNNKLYNEFECFKGKHNYFIIDDICFNTHMSLYIINGLETTVQEILGYDPFVNKEIIPEYVECIKVATRNTKIGEIFKCRYHNGFFEFEYNDKSGISYNSWDGWSCVWESELPQKFFKTSTKEAFDAQNNQKSIEKWSVGSYVVFLKDLMHINAGYIDVIKETLENNCVYLEKYLTMDIGRERSGEVKWFATKSEAEKFAKTLVEPVKEVIQQTIDMQSEFKVGDWVYHRDSKVFQIAHIKKDFDQVQATNLKVFRINSIRHATPWEINNHLISIGQIPAEPICTNTNSNRHDGCGEKYGCIQNCDECDYYQIPAGEPLNTGIEPNKDGMFKYKQTMPGASWSGGTIDNHLDAIIPTTGNSYNKDFSTSVIPVPFKPILSIDDEELPMVSIIKTNSIKQLLNND